MIKKHQGFTLIESLIVMVVLASSMTAALYLLSTVVFSTQQNIKRTKAVYLAQECVELARNLRDTAWADFREWDCAFGAIGDTFVLSPDYSAGSNIDSCSSMPAAVKIEPQTGTNNEVWQVGLGLTNFPPGDPDNVNTGYTRVLRHVDPDSDSDTLDLECEVNWEFNGRPQSVVAPQTLTNWRKE